MPIYNLSLSDHTFSRDDCIRCFYLEVKHNIVYREPFPGMFGKKGDLTSFDEVVDLIMSVKVELTDG